MLAIILAVFSLTTILLAWMELQAHRAWSRQLRLAGQDGERLVADMLDRCGAMDRLDDVVIGESPRWAAQVDHLVRGGERLVVIETKRWSGQISGEDLGTWWTLLGRDGRGKRRLNPVVQAMRQARVIADQVPGVPVSAMVVMAGRARLPDGTLPSGVVTLAEMVRRLPDMVTSGGGANSAAVDTAWESIVERVFDPAHDRIESRYRRKLSERGVQRTWRSWLLVGASFATVMVTMGVVAVRVAEAGGTTPVLLWPW